MTKYKLLIEAEIEVDNWVEIDLTQLDSQGKLDVLDEHDECHSYSYEYALVLEFCNLTIPETINTAEIKKIEVTKIGVDS